MKLLLPIILTCFVVGHVIGAEQDYQAEYFARAVPAAERFVNRLTQEEPWENLGVRSLMDHAYVLAFADRWKADSVSLELTIPLLELAEEMQDKDSESRTFGNLRWYWRTPEVTDRNAVEFITAHALPIWFDARNRLPEEAREILERILHRSINACMVHRVSPDYTNIAIKNAVNLILLGENFDRPDAVQLGKERLQAVLACFWDHGMYEYVSPTYYAPDIDMLQLGYRYVKDEQIKEIFRVMLEFFWTDVAMNWYKPSFRFSGSQSRTYNFVFGVDGHSTRLLEFAGLAPKNPRANSVNYLSSFNAAYTPPQEILALTNKYPRRINQRWGTEQTQWRTTFVLDDIALGTSGAAYGRVKQNMILTVDLADYAGLPAEAVTLLPRSYFISDGREDPYGINRYPTSSAGHQKALHMDQVWVGAQRDGDAIGVALYPAWTLDENVMTNVQSHFVFRKPDAIYLNDRTINLEQGVAQPVGGESVILRYGSRAIGIRVPWTRNKDGESPIPYLIDDGNDRGVYRLTVDHWRKDTPISKEIGDAPGIALWMRIGSHLNTDAKFNEWKREFNAATVDKMDVQGDNISFHVAGVAGSVKIDGRSLSEQRSVINVEPDGPSGILMLDGNDLGRPILEKIPFVADFAQRMTEFAQRVRDQQPVVVDASGAEWEAEIGVCLLTELTEEDGTASGGKAVRINADFTWLFDVKEAGTYYFWARVLALDPEHDSFRIEWRAPDGGRVAGDWHLGQGPTWRWIPLRLNNERPVVPLELTPGQWRLTLRPREMEGRVDKFILTTDPGAVPR